MKINLLYPFGQDYKRIKQLFILMTILFLAGTGKIQAQSYLVGASPFQDSLWVIDTTNFEIVQRMAPIIPSKTITGIVALTQHPGTGVYYVVCKVSAVSGRVLGTLDLTTGIVTEIGNLGDNFSTLTFNGNNTLIGVTGDGATVPETAYRINITDASKTLLTALGHGADGEVIAYNPDDNMIYHWSGNGTVVYEKFDTSGTTVTGIPIIGSTNGETFGAVYIGNGRFLTSNISSSLNIFDTQGNVTGPFGSMPDDLRGLAFFSSNVPPAISAINDASVCLNAYFPPLAFTVTDADDDNVSLSATSSNQGVIADVNISLLPAGSTGTPINGTITITGYVGTGTTTITVYANDGQSVSASTQFDITVMSLPTPAIYVSGDTEFCTGKNVHLYTDTYASYRWKKDNVTIPGATDFSLIVTTSGDYKVEIKDDNGCKGTTDVITVIANPLPDVAIEPAGITSICNGTALDISVADGQAAYVWYNNNVEISGETSNTISTTSAGSFKVKVTSDKGCVAISNVAVVFVKESPPLPTIIFTGTSLISSSLTGNQWFESDVAIQGETDQELILASNGEYSVSVTNANDCSTMSAPMSVTNLSLATAQRNDPISVFPNPFENYFIVASHESGIYELIDVKGQVVTAGKITATAQKIYGEQLAKGVYELKLTFTNTPAKVYKLIK